MDLTIPHELKVRTVVLDELAKSGGGSPNSIANVGEFNMLNPPTVLSEEGVTSYHVHSPNPSSHFNFVVKWGYTPSDPGQNQFMVYFFVDSTDDAATIQSLFAAQVPPHLVPSVSGVSTEDSSGLTISFSGHVYLYCDAANASDQFPAISIVDTYGSQLTQSIDLDFGDVPSGSLVDEILFVVENEFVFSEEEVLTNGNRHVNMSFLIDSEDDPYRETALLWSNSVRNWVSYGVSSPYVAPIISTKWVNQIASTPPFPFVNDPDTQAPRVLIKELFNGFPMETVFESGSGCFFTKYTNLYTLSDAFTPLKTRTLFTNYGD